MNAVFAEGARRILIKILLVKCVPPVYHENAKTIKSAFPVRFLLQYFFLKEMFEERNVAAVLKVLYDMSKDYKTSMLHQKPRIIDSGYP